MVFQHFELFPHLSIIENLTLAQVKVLNRGKVQQKEGAKIIRTGVGLLTTLINTLLNFLVVNNNALLLLVLYVWIYCDAI